MPTFRTIKYQFSRKKDSEEDAQMNFEQEINELLEIGWKIISSGYIPNSNDFYGHYWAHLLLEK